MSFRITPERLFHTDGTLPNHGEVFVFGSNLRGAHGKGAAKVAREKFGAVYGQGIGHVGQSYGIPTKDESLKVLTFAQIVYGVDEFIKFTYRCQDLRFFVTAVGCGLAHFDPVDIAPLFSMAIHCSFPEEWRIYLE
jgi:hypothetical protein